MITRGILFPEEGVVVTHDQIWHMWLGRSSSEVLFMLDWATLTLCFGYGIITFECIARNSPDEPNDHACRRHALCMMALLQIFAHAAP
jgi:hypothetical protein